MQKITLGTRVTEFRARKQNAKQRSGGAASREEGDAPLLLRSSAPPLLRSSAPPLLRSYALFRSRIYVALVARVVKHLTQQSMKKHCTGFTYSSLFGFSFNFSKFILARLRWLDRKKPPRSPLDETTWNRYKRQSDIARFLIRYRI